MTTSASGSPKLLLRAALHPSIASFSSSLRVVVAIMASTGAAPTGRGLIAAEHHLARADLCREVTERLGGEYQRVEIRLLQIIGLVASAFPSQVSSRGSTSEITLGYREFEVVILG